LTAAGSAAETLDLAALVRHHIDAENRRDLDAVMDTVAPGDAAEYLVKSTGERWHTREAIRRFYGDWFAAVPDLRIDIVTVTADPLQRRVVVEVHITGTLKGPFGGLLPNGRSFSLDSAVVYELDPSGKLTLERSHLDKTQILETMGLIADTKTPLGRFLLLATQSPIYAVRCALHALRARVGTSLA
jgi:steroid delta-isomerase-like uncharacterized protein